MKTPEMTMRSLLLTLPLVLLVACSPRGGDSGAAAGAAPDATSKATPQQPTAAPLGDRGSNDARPGADVMDAKGGVAGALVGTGQTYGGPTHFGGPLKDPEIARLADAPSGMIDPMHGRPTIDEQPPVAPLANAENKDIRRNRSFVLQPPTIPHKIDGYQIDTNANRCMTCHARTRIEESRAVPVSITHYTDRNGNMLADISPRRYFCEQCHVVQTEVNLVVANRYEDVERIVRQEAASRQGSAAGKRAAPDAPKGDSRAGQPAAKP
jgi:cytochrome c-type protein NapB